MRRLEQVVLIVSVILGSWLGMQAAHELGHVIGAWVSGARVARVELNPLTFSRTDLTHNPDPLLVAWTGPAIGSLLPLGAWAVLRLTRCPGVYLARFFAGFCLIANGVYISAGSFERMGDAGDLQRDGSPIWLLWLFGAAAVPAGLWLWHNQGTYFGLGPARGQVSRRAAYFSLAAAAAWAVGTFLMCRK